MTPRGLILALKSPFSGLQTTGPRASALPPNLLREARRRLGILGGCYREASRKISLPASRNAPVPYISVCSGPVSPGASPTR